jgi:hypothetical protein
MRPLLLDSSARFPATPPSLDKSFRYSIASLSVSPPPSTGSYARAVRQELSAPLVANLEQWLRERPELSRGNDLAKAMDYMLKRWPAFTRFFDDGRICLSNNAAERALRGIAVGRKSWLFAGSDRVDSGLRRYIA